LLFLLLRGLKHPTLLLVASNEHRNGLRTDGKTTRLTIR